MQYVCCGASAQTQLTEYQPGVTPEGAVYFLPKTALRFVVRVEKTVYTPGDFCKYAQKYLRLAGVNPEKETSHRVLSINMSTYGIADKAKAYAVKFNAKSAASNMELADDGTLLAINAHANKRHYAPAFVPAPRPAAANPRRYMSEEILAAGSTAKMASLTAQEIYNIRESRNALTRGEADYMPKDGEQLRLMLEQLDKQDRALTQMFSGTTVKDTAEYVLTLCPDGEIERDVLFRLSKQMGLTDHDDLGGSPYYISVKSEGNLPPRAPEDAKAKKKDKPEEGIYVNVPGKILVTISRGNEELDSFEVMAGQFGYTELLSAELFNKRYTTHLTLVPETGGVQRLDAEQPK